jgi:four helix bundle protein
MSNNIIVDKSIEFALSCIILYQKLQQEAEYVISKQILRSWTSIWANIAEANAAQSKKDFYAKMCIAYKEAHETQYWLILLEKSTLTRIDISSYQKACNEIIRLLAKIKLTTENNLKNP